MIREGHSGVMSIKAKHLVPGDVVEVSSMFLYCNSLYLMMCNILFGNGDSFKHLGVLINGTI